VKRRCLTGCALYSALGRCAWCRGSLTDRVGTLGITVPSVQAPFFAVLIPPAKTFYGMAWEQPGSNGAFPVCSETCHQALRQELSKGGVLFYLVDEADGQQQPEPSAN
jgi:hypothetical protein